MFDAWMTIVMPHEVTRDYWPPAPPVPAGAAASAAAAPERACRARA